MNASILPLVIRSEKSILFGLIKSHEYRYDLNQWKVDTVSASEDAPVVHEDESKVILPSFRLNLHRRYELTQKDFDKLHLIKARLDKELSPLLLEHGLHFLYRSGGGPNDIPKHFDGSLFWEIQISKRSSKASFNEPDMFCIYITAKVGRYIDVHTKEVFYNRPYVDFIIRFRHRSHNCMEIPTIGIGSAFYLEELLVRMEQELPPPEIYADLELRLDWHCKMIKKHHHEVLSDIPTSVLVDIFDEIRSRAISK